MSKEVDYYVSLASPYTYMGGRRLPEIIESTGAAFYIKPVIGSQLLAATGGLPVPKRHPARLAYRLVELERWKRHWSIPMNIEPKFFPVDDGKAAHMVIAAQQLGQDAITLSNVFCIGEIPFASNFASLASSPAASFCNLNCSAFSLLAST